MAGILQHLYKAKQHLIGQISLREGGGNAFAESLDFELALCAPVSGMTLDRLLGYVEGRILEIEAMLKKAIGDELAKGVIAKLTVSTQVELSQEQTVTNKPTGGTNAPST